MNQNYKSTPMKKAFSFALAIFAMVPLLLFAGFTGTDEL
jgi:hypothetical protein